MKISRKTAWSLFWLGPVAGFIFLELTGNGTLATMLVGGMMIVVWYKIVRGNGEVEDGGTPIGPSNLVEGSLQQGMAEIHHQVDYVGVAFHSCLVTKLLFLLCNSCTRRLIHRCYGMA